MAQVTVFISYSSADRNQALAVRRLLTGRGCTVWLDVFDIRVAADLKRELGGGIAGADILCLLLSPTAVASQWVDEEIARGEEQAKSRGLRVIAVLLRPCRPPDSLLGRVMLDATAGIDSPDVSARLVRAVLGKEVVGDTEIDAAMQEALQARQNELEAAQVLPELAQKLTAVREQPVREILFSFRQVALPRDKTLAVGLTFDTLFAQPMWFLFAHYREGHTWPKWMKLEELDHSEVPSDGKRIDGRFQWFDRVTVLSPQIDGTDLRDLPATFHLQLSGKRWQPGGANASYDGGPTVPHLAQRLEIPALARLTEKGATFSASLVGQDSAAEQVVVPEENDLDIRVTAAYESGEHLTLFRSAHCSVERAILKGAYLVERTTQIERETILGLYPRTAELAAAERLERRRAAHALLEKPEEELSPEERRIAAVLRYAQAKLDVFRVFASAPPPGPARDMLHAAAIQECQAVCRLLEPLIAADPQIDEVGMAYWATSNLAHYYEAGRAPDRSLPYAEAALSLVRDAAAKVQDEPEYRRWMASALERLARAQASSGDHARGMTSLAESIDILHRLYEELPNTGRRQDLQDALAAAIDPSEKWEGCDAATRQRWVAMASELKSSATAGGTRSSAAKRPPTPRAKAPRRKR